MGTHSGAVSKHGVFIIITHGYFLRDNKDINGGQLCNYKSSAASSVGNKTLKKQEDHPHPLMQPTVSAVVDTQANVGITESIRARCTCSLGSQLASSTTVTTKSKSVAL